MIIDSHQRYWKLSRGDYGWLTPESGPLLYQDYMPDQIKQEIKRCNIAGTIVVQAAPTIEEIDFLLDLCELEETVLDVVGFLDVNGVDFEKHYVKFRANPRFVGIRPQFPDVADGDWSRYQVLLHNLALLEEDGFPVELLIRRLQLPVMAKLLEQVPKIAAIVDHLGLPDITNKQFAPGAEGMGLLAQFEHTVCKLSGLATGSGGGPWKAADVAVYVNYVLVLFGTERIMFGSDWPVCLLAGGYNDMYVMAQKVLPHGMTSAQSNAIFGGNAARIYRISLKQK